MRNYLLVDDNLAFAENVAEILRDSGADVTVAEGGPQALELVGKIKFDAVVTDMRMPVMSGAKLVHEIRRIDHGLPAIVVTAYTGENDLLAAREEGLLAVLPKPVPLERLGGLLDAARRNALVALVEDDMMLADNLAEALRDRGFSAVTARSIAETERLGGVEPFMALVDLRPPGSPDAAALERLLARFPGLPVLTFPRPFDTGRILEAVEELWE